MYSTFKCVFMIRIVFFCIYLAPKNSPQKKRSPSRVPKKRSTRKIPGNFLVFAFLYTTIFRN